MGLLLTSKGKRWLSRKVAKPTEKSYIIRHLAEWGGSYSILEHCCGAAEICVERWMNNRVNTLLAMLRASTEASILIATCSSRQSEEEKLLRSLGWKATRWVKNPNSDNNICLLTHLLPIGLVKVDRSDGW